MEVDVLKLRLFYRSSITRATARASEVTKRNLTAKEIDNWAGESASLTKEKEMLKYRHTHTHAKSIDTRWKARPRIEEERHARRVSVGNNNHSENVLATRRARPSRTN